MRSVMQRNCYYTNNYWMLLIMHHILKSCKDIVKNNRDTIDRLLCKLVVLSMNLNRCDIMITTTWKNFMNILLIIVASWCLDWYQQENSKTEKKTEDGHDSWPNRKYFINRYGLKWNEKKNKIFYPYYVHFVKWHNTIKLDWIINNLWKNWDLDKISQIMCSR